MNNKKGNLALIVIAAILVLLVIILMIIYFSLDNGKEKSSNTSNSSSNSNSVTTTTTDTTKSENKTDESTNKENTNIDTKTDTKEEIKDTSSKTAADDESGPEEVKKIDESQGKIYEKELTVSNNKVVKIPVINLTTKAATRINSEIEKKYKDEYTNGNYIVYYYYMYVGMVSVILDHRYSSGEHSYDLYNVNSETGKQMTNENLLEKLKVSKADFLSKAKTAYKEKFEEIFKTVDKNSNEYKKGLETTLKNAEDALNSPMFINLEAQFACYAKIPNVGGGESYQLLEFN